LRLLVNERLTLKVAFKTEEDTEAAAKFFNDTIRGAGWNVTPKHTAAPKANNCFILIKQKIEEKRRLHRNWHRLCTLGSKRLLNAAIQDLKQVFK
jgi:hypothetical protein